MEKRIRFSWGSARWVVSLWGKTERNSAASFDGAVLLRPGASASLFFFIQLLTVMALSAVTFKPKVEPISELSTMSEEQPLEDEDIERRASFSVKSCLFVGTRGSRPQPLPFLPCPCLACLALALCLWHFTQCCHVLFY